MAGGTPVAGDGGVARRLAGDPEWVSASGRNGLTFFHTHSGWDVVLAELRRLIEATAA